MKNWKYTRSFPLILLLIALAGGCRQGAQPEAAVPTPLPAGPTATTGDEALAEAPTAAATSTTAPTEPAPTPQPATATPLPTEAAAPEAAPETETYRVSYVSADDTLNVRAGPGVENEIVGELAPTAGGVTITGAGQKVAGSTWVPIAAGDVQGWVNGRFLTADISADAFCQSEAVRQLLADLETAVANRDGATLAELIHPERGLRIRRHWWNPEVRIEGAQLSQLFSSQTGYEWGRADGSGNPIVGSFNEVIYPLLEQNLLGATESACNEILHGGTAGLVQLPDGYQQQNFYSFFRPGSEEFSGMDWGSWVVGVERWRGEFYISFLVHFEWEI